MPNPRTPDNENRAGNPSRQERQRHRRKPGRQQSGDRANLGLHRHQARILALQVTYEVDVTDHALTDVMSRTFGDPDEVIMAEVRAYAEHLVHGIMQHRPRIDDYIAAAAPAFPVSQLPSVDRNVLRVAIYELLQEPEVPVKAAINEAVELAKRYGGMNSSRFVNGVLGAVAKRVEQERSAAVPAADPLPKSRD